MRKITKLMAALALLVFMAPNMVAWGQTRTNYEFNLNELYQDGTLVTAKTVITESGGTLTFTDQNENFTILLTRNSGNQPGFYTSSGYFRFYSSDTFKLSAADGITMTQITVTPNGSSFSVAAMEGLNTSTKTWTGSASEVTFTGSGTNKWDKLTITYSSGGSQTTTYTVTYNANVAGTAPVVDTYAEGANVTLRAANTFTNEGYTFSEWNTQADGDGDAYDAGEVIEGIDDDIELYAIWTENPVSDDHWVLTELADLTSTDVFVIVGNNGSNYAMKNTDASNSGPAAIAVTVSGTELSGTVPDNIKWNISGNATDGYVFYPNGSTTTWLYCTNNNNGLRIGSGNTDYNTFEIKASYIYNKGRGRYVGIYNSTDWRSYTSSGGNIANQTFAFYKKVTGSVPPSITANNVSIAYDATSGEIEYTLNNPAANGSLSVSDNVDWISNAVLSTTESKVTFTTTANEATTAREGIITITYTYNRETISKDVTVTQAAAPVIYTTIPALFAAATGTETSVLVTFNNWVVSGVSSNGKNVFVTDNNGNGFVIYGTDMNNNYTVGDILTGTAVSCNLKKYNGFAELLNVTASDLTITSGGTVSTANVALADLSGINTGSLLHYEGLTCDVRTNSEGTSTYYYLTDGTTDIQVYNAIYAFGTLVDGKTYNITGIYQQYNSIKEILPRSATDIEVVEVQHEEYTLTIGEMSHVSEIFLFDSDNESESIEITNNAATITDGTTVMVSFTIESGYVFESINVTYGDNQTVETTEIEPGEYYSFEMPAANATLAISATEYVAPSGDQYELYSGALVEGDYLIVYDGGAMNTTVTSDRLQYEAVTATNNVITTDNAAIVWHIAPSGQYWTIYNANADAYAASTGAKNKAQMLSDGTDDKALWTVSGTETYEFVNKQNTANNVNANLRKNGTFGFACYATSTGGALSLYKKVEDTPTGYPLTIVGVGEENWDEGEAGYYLIASPVTVDPSTVGMTTGEFDLYYFDQAEDDEWQNWKDNDETGHFNLVPGKGYLYAHKTGGQFTLTGTPYTGNGQIRLTKTDDASVDFQGWNLVGNPFGELAYLPERDYYIMKADGSEIIAPTNPSYSVEAMQGVFVIAEEDGETITFTTTRPANNGKSIALNLSNGSNVIDRTIIRFGQGRQLPKFQLNKNHTKVYIPQDGQDYAVVRSEEMGEMPVNFKAENNGSYTLNLSSENVEFAYLHLIDNLTGANIDMLQTPSYSFDAKTTDYENRFKLVFATGSSTGSDTFAFYSNGSFVINNDGNATLQVVDVTGRIIKCESINGCANVNVNSAPGVYMLRLVNGDNVKVQKVVVK